jgi:hypothetical protein
MKPTTIITFIISVALDFGIPNLSGQSSAFTYQGQLTQSGSPANGLYEMQFTLFDAATNSNQVGLSVTVAPVAVINGLFSATLDFGAAPFDGSPRWLEIAVNVYGSDGVTTILRPRQSLTPTPYAIRAAHFSGPVADGQLSVNVARLDANQTFTGAVNFNSPANRFAGAFSGNGAAVSNVNLATINSSGAITSAYPDPSFILSSSPAAGDGCQGPVVADVNGEGRPDLITANLHADTLSILTNDGHAGFALASSPSVGDGPVMVAAADVNGDDAIDLISVNSYGGRISVLFNNGSGAFTLASSPAVGREPASIAAVDLNGDGKPDLVTANIRDDNLSLLINNGSGGFGAPASLAAGDGPISVCAADVNGDGRPDLISANRDGDNLSVLTNRGGGVFVLSSSPAVGHYPFWVTSADVNGDNSVDLITANLADSTLSVLTNDGSGGFALAGSLNAETGPYSVVAADFNGDGHPDLACANQFSESVTMFINNGPGSFAQRMTLIAGDGSIGVVASDLDQDGRTDLVCANWLADNLSIFLHDDGPPIFTFSGNFTGTANLSGVFSGDGSGLTALSANSLTSGTVPASALDNAWKIEGNAGTAADTHFLGTTDDQPLELKVNGQRALRLEPKPGGVPNVIGGSQHNVMHESVAASTIGGGDNNLIGSDAFTATIAGGANNYIGGPTGGSTISGGVNNSIQEESSGGAISGGWYNSIADGADNSTIAGGWANGIGAEYAVVGGGIQNYVAFPGHRGVIGGGFSNRVNGYAAFVGGGGRNEAGGFGAVIGGGGGLPYESGDKGIGNTAGGDWSTVGGGSGNVSSGVGASIGGGYSNSAMGDYATVPGGFLNSAGGTYSLAAGRRAKTDHSGAFVFADSTDAEIASTTNDQFTVRASGGVRLLSSTNGTSGVELAPGSGSWSMLSDRDAKENFAPADTGAILRRVADLQLTTWNYKSQDKSVRHLGPTAQEFQAAFALGESERSISSVDADGVALAAIQALNQKLEQSIAEKDDRIRQLEQAVQDLQELVGRLSSK